MKKYIRMILIPSLLFFSASIFFSQMIEKIGGIRDIFDVDDEDESI
jgi:hypothetical protein